MDNREKYLKAFLEVLEITESQTAGLAYQSVGTWDSVGHMRLVSALEESFDIMFDTEDVIGLDSFEKGKEILSSKYGVEF